MIFGKLLTLAQMHADGWYNPISGLGDYSRDKSKQGSHVKDVWLDDDQLSSLFHQNDLAARIVDLPVKEALRQGIKLPKKGGSDVLAALNKLGALAKVQEAAIWGRLYGGAVLVVGAFDGRPSWEPIDWRQVKQLGFLRVFDRRDVYREYDRDVFRINEIDGRSHRVHFSRCFVFGGAQTGDREKQELQGWDASVLQRCYAPMRAFEEAFNSAGVLVSESSVGVFKMRGLLAAIAGGQRNDLVSRAVLLDMTKSVARSIFLDADKGEDYRRESVQFSGLSDVLDRASQRLAAAAEIPLTKLLGVSPAGLNATGESDIRNFYDSVRSYQANELRPVFQRLVDVQSALSGVERQEIVFPSLWQESPKETADRRESVARTDKLYFDMGAVTEEQIARSRWRAEGYSEEMLPPDPASMSLLEQGPQIYAYELEGGIVKINEARARKGLPAVPWGDQTLPELLAQLEAQGSIAVEQAKAAASAVKQTAEEETKLAESPGGSAP